MSIPRHIRSLAIAIALSGTACGAAAVPGPATSAPGAATPQPAALPPSSTALSTVGGSLWLRDHLGHLRVLDAKGGAIAQLPLGVPAPDWSRLYTLDLQGGSSRLHALDPQTGLEIAGRTVSGAWELPGLGPTESPAGLSPDGRWLVVAGGQRATDGPRPASLFLVENTTFATPPRSVRIEGDWVFDGISNDGNSLFLLEALGGGDAYRVRRYDMNAGALDSKVIVDKSDGSEAMSGLYLASVDSRDGQWKFSTYGFGQHGAFLHALHLDAADIALCIDLPGGAGGDEMELLWTPVLSSDGRTLYVVNGGLGAVVQIDTADVQVTRTASFAVGAAQPAAYDTGGFGTPVEAKRLVARGAVLSGDGGSLYAIADDGVVQIDTATLTMRRHLLAGWQAVSLSFSSAGRTLLVLDQRQQAIAELDVASGRLAGTLPVSGADIEIVRVTG